MSARLLFAYLALALLAAFRPAAAADLPLERIKLPPGFKIELYARVPGARTMVLMEDWGIVIVRSRGPNVQPSSTPTRTAAPTGWSVCSPASSSPTASTGRTADSTSPSSTA
ncbi:MAG: hypothetical protein VW338_17410 [Rhodospirillaceae bacterium]